MHLSLKNNSWRPKGRLVLLCIVLFFVISCGKHKLKNSTVISLNVLNKSDINIDSAILTQAKYSDIPVPIGFQIADQSENDMFLFENRSDFLAYQGESGIADLLIFYQKNLEVAGWRINDLSNEHEGLLICDKPQKQLVISLRSLDDKNANLCLFIKNNSKQSVKHSDRVDSINSKNIVDLNPEFQKSSGFNRFKKG